MKVVVYGTLKRGYGNNSFLKDATFLEEVEIPNHTLFYSVGKGSFPVAKKEEGSTIIGELFDISNDPKNILNGLDWLESEGVMYDRVNILGSDDTYMYLGNKDYWRFDKMERCEQDNKDRFIWSRNG